MNSSTLAKIIKMFGLSIVFILISTQQSLGQKKPAGKDLSKLYRAHKIILGKNKIPSFFFKSISPYKIILIPGVLSESFFKESKQKLKVNFITGNIFEDHERFLKKHNVDYQKLLLESENPPLKNSFNIEKAILASKKKVLLFSHSKGGLDAWEAIKRNPSLLSKIKGWATVQTPFRGSAVAEFFDSYKPTQNLSKWLFQFLGGNLGGFQSLSINIREPYMKKPENKMLAETINKRINFINFASIRPDTRGWDSPLELFRDYAYFKKGDNDGVVHIESALLPGVNFIIEKNVDHLLTVVNCNKIKKVSFRKKASLKNRWPFDRVNHFKSILYLLSKSEK